MQSFYFTISGQFRLLAKQNPKFHNRQVSITLRQTQASFRFLLAAFVVFVSSFIILANWKQDLVKKILVEDSRKVDLAEVQTFRTDQGDRKVYILTVRDGKMYQELLYTGPKTDTKKSRLIKSLENGGITRFSLPNAIHISPDHYIIASISGPDSADLMIADPEGTILTPSVLELNRTQIKPPKISFVEFISDKRMRVELGSGSVVAIDIATGKLVPGSR